LENVKKVYENNCEFDRLLRHRMEFYINSRFIKENLPNKGLSILDLGGGVGRYSIELTKVGHKVTLVDLSDRNIEDAKKLCRDQNIELFKIQQGNALDLSFLKENSFDAVLVMGPFYHIKEEINRIKCINEIKRVLIKGGVLFSAHLTRYAFFKYVVANFPEEIDKFYDNFINVFECGSKLTDDGDLFTDNTYTENAEHILDFMGKSGFTESEIIASEGLVDHIEDKLQNLDLDKFLKVAELNYISCKDKYILNAASHLLYKGILKK
jgi:ubiquinone/menaquinone biosynthesis C-methylase UbiE